VRKVNAALPAVEAIPAGPVSAVLPQNRTGWPRTVFAVVDDTTLTADGLAKPQVAVMLVQDDARSNYKAQYVVRLEPGTAIPDLAPASVGAASLLPDSKFLTVAPDTIAANYGDLLLNDTASPTFDLFEADRDSLRVGAGLPWKTARIAKFLEDGTSTLAFSSAPSTGPIISLATNEVGALVAVDVNEVETAKPVETGAEVKATGEVTALTGKTVSTKGFTITYGYQLLFFVPSAIAGGKITLLGFSQGTTSVSEIP
jgi:hypothetical protein